MSNTEEYIELVKRAQLGDEDSMNKLAGLARERLRVFVYRLTLREDLSQDIVQESLLEMFKVLGKLKRADRFWPWIYTITYNKVRRHWRNEKRRKSVSIGEMDFSDNHKDSQGGLENMVAEELKHVVLSAMQQLKDSHRAVLTMRCYDNMKYSEIAELMGSSELGVRMLFLRAKRSLGKQLSRRGLGKGALLTALVVFGKVTSSSEAAAAQVSVTAAAMKVGAVASVAGVVASKATVVSLAAAGVLAAGTMVMTPGDGIGSGGNVPNNFARVSRSLTSYSEDFDGIEKQWRFYPEQSSDIVMTRLMVSDGEGSEAYCKVLQDDRFNYFYDKYRNKVYMNNFRTWAGDLSVPVLPTDSPEMVSFLSQVQVIPKNFRHVESRKDGLLVTSTYDKAIDSGNSLVIEHSNVLQEDYFRYTWPAGSEFVDKRDAMHSRGWCFFNVKGKVGDSEIIGYGRLPFVYEASRKYGPWLKLKVESPEGTRYFLDGKNGAVISDSDMKVTTGFPSGSFFEGISRPWMGLHTIDTIRRDAAKKQLRFETDYNQGDLKAEVSIYHGAITAVYIIDMEKDVVDSISFFTESGGEPEPAGKLEFAYLQKPDTNTLQYRQPVIQPKRSLMKESEGISWIERLAR